MMIRSASADDFPHVVALLRQLLPTDPPAGEAARSVFDAILASANLDLLVAEQDGRVVASCYLNLIPNLTRGARPYAVIENVITHEQYRQRGIGKALLGEAVARAEKAGCYKVMLMTGRKDAAVHAFYRACGFSADTKQAYQLRFD